MSRSSMALPEPSQVPGSGRWRRCIKPANTVDPAVSASAESSRSEFSASVTVPSVHTDARTTRSRRSWRYSTSVTSVSSVERPSRRRSAARSSRSNWSPSRPKSSWVDSARAEARPASTSSVARFRDTGSVIVLPRSHLQPAVGQSVSSGPVWAGQGASGLARSGQVRARQVRARPTARARASGAEIRSALASWSSAVC